MKTTKPKKRRDDYTDAAWATFITMALVLLIAVGGGLLARALS